MKNISGIIPVSDTSFLEGDHYYNSSTDMERAEGNDRCIWYDTLCLKFRNFGGLSPAEFRVIYLLLKGFNNEQIAVILSRSQKTISAQKCSAFKKLGIKNDATILAALLKLELVNIYYDVNHLNIVVEKGK